MPTVLLEHLDERVTLVTLNRPEQLNAITFELVRELHDAFDTIAGDPECRVAILTGAGRRFCVGLDLRNWGTPPEPGEHPRSPVGVGGQEFLANLTVHIRQTPQIVIAAVNGPAFGGGLSLACAADIRIAADTARFCSAFIRTGLSGTDAGISFLLPQIIGPARAFELIVSGRDINAAEADRIGLVTSVVASDALIGEARSRAATIAGYTSTGLVLTKEAFWHNVGNADMAAAIALENRNQRIASQTPEVQEYMAAYSKRHKE